MRIGTRCADDGSCEFVVWAPRRKSVALELLLPEQTKTIPMHRRDDGYWEITVPEVGDGTRYRYRLDEEVSRPDPASRFQPDGVHEASQVVNHGLFRWHDDGWTGRPARDTIQYELHIGTFTPEGTFDAAIPRLEKLVELGINAVDVMPLAQFPGSRNWGYDGVYPYAVQSSYGGPGGFKRFVDAAHRMGLAVILDVVYNHLGPEGNYLHEFGPYFTSKYRTPWGWAINFDGPDSDEVREYFIENALMWFRDYHVDGLRLDAIHGIFDMSARPFLRVLQERVEGLAGTIGRNCDLIAESDLNDSRVIRKAECGFGLPAQWSDDFHHALHTLLTGEQGGYYKDFGDLEQLVTAMREGYVFSGQYSSYRRRSHGNTTADLPAARFVVFSQNHDQVGNRMMGDRMTTLVSFEGLKLAAGAVLLAPNIPMLFMGEEYGEEAPFLYFVSHGDPDLVAAVRKGRKEEFQAFGWAEEPPDPQSEETFQRSKLHWEERTEGKHGVLLKFYDHLIDWRRSIPALAAPSKEGLVVRGYEEARVVSCVRQQLESAAFYVMNFSDQDQTLRPEIPEGVWKKVLDSADELWNGPGSRLAESLVSGDTIESAPWSVALYIK